MSVGSESPLKIVRVKESSLTIDPKNLREHSRRNLDVISASIKAHKQVEPLIVQAGTGKVIGGNGRLSVIRELGIDEVDIIELEIDDKDAQLLAIRLNRSAEHGEWKDTLAETLEALQQEGIDLNSIGFSDEEFHELCDKLAGDMTDGSGEIPENPVYSNQYAVTVLCQDEGSQEETYNRLVGMGYECKVVVV